MRHHRRIWPNSSTWLRSEQSANAIMIRQAQQRSSARIFVRLPAWITLQAGEREHVAFVRDISPRGIFFYSDFMPPEGERMGFVLEYLSGTNRTRLHLQGRVVRLERAGQDSAVGIAVWFDSQCQVPRFPIRSAAI